MPMTVHREHSLEEWFNLNIKVNLTSKMSDLQNIKNRFGIIGNYPALNRALEKAIQVAPTDISVLVIGDRFGAFWA